MDIFQQSTETTPEAQTTTRVVNSHVEHDAVLPKRFSTISQPNTMSVVRREFRSVSVPRVMGPVEWLEIGH